MLCILLNLGSSNRSTYHTWFHWRGWAFWKSLYGFPHLRTLVVRLMTLAFPKTSQIFLTWSFYSFSRKVFIGMFLLFDSFRVHRFPPDLKQDFFVYRRPLHMLRLETNQRRFGTIGVGLKQHSILSNSKRRYLELISQNSSIRLNRRRISYAKLRFYLVYSS